MRPKLSDWTLVLAGRWNVDILSPDWVAQTIFDATNCEIQMTLDGVRNSLSYIFEDVVFFPQDNRVVLNVRRADEKCLRAAENAALKLTQALPVTPVKGVGFNFGYTEDNPDSELLKLFQSEDTAKLLDLSLQEERITIAKQMKFGNSILTLSLISFEGRVDVILNYHFDTSGNIKPSDCLGENAVKFEEHAKQLLSRVYSLELSNGEE
jgi:hypothetical protein